MSTSATPSDAAAAAQDADRSVIRWAPSITPRRIVFFIIAWLSLFAVMSVFVSNPFQSETSAAASPDYAHVMFLHGLLIGMVGLMALLTCQVLSLRSLHVRLAIAIGVVVATVLASVGGIWDKTIPGSEVAMWTQILGFFALDEILIALIIGLAGEWWRRREARTLPFVAAMLASVSMLLAAVMGHLAGWIMEFGWNTPGVVGDYARFAGFGTQDDFTGALVGSHSHEMAVAAMALTAVLFAQQFGYTALGGASRAVGRAGMAMISLGVVGMTGMYAVAGFNNWAPPPWFVSGSGGANGVASDDVITGILVMGGGVVVGIALLAGRFGAAESIFARPARLAALWSWILSFATVVVAGYAIEMNETYFGGGDPKATGASKDAVFTWMHQDVGLFLLPSLVLIMLVVERLVRRGRPNWIAWSTIAGTSVSFVGGLIWVFVDPALHGPGFAISTAGLAVVGAAILATLWWGAIAHLPSMPSLSLPHLRHTHRRPTPLT